MCANSGTIGYGISANAEEDIFYQQKTFLSLIHVFAKKIFYITLDNLKSYLLPRIKREYV